MNSGIVINIRYIIYLLTPQGHFFDTSEVLIGNRLYVTGPFKKRVGKNEMNSFKNTNYSVVIPKTVCLMYNK